MSEIFSTRLIEQRNKKGLTQYSFAEALKKKRSTISGYETEGKEPSLDTLCEFAKFFGVSADYLLGLSNNPGNRDDLMFHISSKVKDLYFLLPTEQRDTVAEIYAAFYSVLEGDMRSACSAQLETYLDLLSLIADRRKAVKEATERFSASADLRSITDVLSVQNEFKAAVNALLDRLLREDLRTAFDEKGE